MSGETKKTILLVEDEVIIALVEKVSLEKYGYNVISADTGEKAIEIIEKTSGIDLILMDVNLGGGIDGTEVARIILEKYNLPLLFLSSHTERGIVEKIEGITSYGYIVKNSGETVLVASIKMAFKLFEANKQIRESEDRYRILFENTGTSIIIIEEDTTISFANDEFVRRTGYPRSEIEGVKRWTEIIDREDIERIVEQHNRRREIPQDTLSSYEYRYKTKSGELRNALINIQLIPGMKKSMASLIDITEHKHAEKEKSRLEAQLAHAQKMESVGRLAGGVAHDFNNMLGVILGHAELALANSDLAQPIQAHLEEIRKAAERSADLTRQLLAFARKQTVSPMVINLSKTVEGMLKLLHRLIGEDIHLNWNLSENLWMIMIDPSQIDQILANLCVNARDAINDVGQITIETGNSDFDAAYCATHAGFMPGEYVRLVISDNGCGMDKETLGHLFEPFFTTKGVGKGTGLGLAMVYGIVKQNNGFIYAYSEPDHGTTFTIYLPRHVGKAGHVPVEDSSVPASRGYETILLVEDDPAILNLTATMLEMQGYTVLSASTTGEAIRLAGEHASELHLLITDVVMPEMNGRDLAKCLLSTCPHIKCLFMSGYTANVIAHHGVLDEGVFFIQKPFSIKDLAAKVRESLDR